MDAMLFVALVTLTAFAPRLLPAGSAGSTLTVRTTGGVVTVSLAKDAVHPVDGPLGQARLVVADGRAHLQNAPCPLKICEGMGPVGMAGEVIVCLPNRIAVRVDGKGEVDAVSR
ncbi:MAG: NusG domain II-containing protein [bacterium]|nr:NusG domain II-containing protein [bacterium]